MLFQAILVSAIFGLLYIACDIMQKIQDNMDKNTVVNF